MGYQQWISGFSNEIFLGQKDGNRSWDVARVGWMRLQGISGSPKKLV